MGKVSLFSVGEFFSGVEGVNMESNRERTRGNTETETVALNVTSEPPLQGLNLRRLWRPRAQDLSVTLPDSPQVKKTAEAQS